MEKGTLPIITLLLILVGTQADQLPVPVLFDHDGGEAGPTVRYWVAVYVSGSTGCSSCVCRVSTRPWRPPPKHTIC